MKTLLVPTDFSRTSRNAINYAAGIARRCKASLILFHSYLPPIMISDVPVIIPLPAEIEKESLKKLKRIAASLRVKYGENLKIELVCKYGLASDIISEFAKEKKADLIVMGIQGAGYIEEKFAGSITTETIKKSKIPVLSVGKQFVFKKIKNIAFATDYLALKDPSTLSPLKEIASIFKSHVHIVNVVPDKNSVPTSSQAVQGIGIEHILEAQDHSFHCVVNKNISEGINEFVKSRKIDLVVMIPRKHPLLKSIFKQAETKKVAFHSNAPLLTIHE